MYNLDISGFTRISYIIWKDNVCTVLLFGEVWELIYQELEFIDIVLNT